MYCTFEWQIRQLLLFGFLALLSLIYFILMSTHFDHVREIPPVKFEFPPVDRTEIAKLRESYLNQERSMAIHNQFDERFLARAMNANSDSLPPRLFKWSADEFCSNSEKAYCVPPFAPFKQMIVGAPEHRMMSCLIHKSMSTVMNAIFCFLIRREEFVNGNRSLLKEYGKVRLCKGVNEFISVEQARYKMNVQLRDMDNWKLTMVTRDPIDRILSGFIDRCIRHSDDCAGCRRNMTCFLEKEHERMFNYAWAEKNHIRRQLMSRFDRHTFPQNWRCQLDRYYEHYEFLRYSNDPSETLLKDLARIMREQEVPEESINYIEKELTSGRTAHTTSDTKVRVFLENRLRSSPYLMELVIRMFYWDYKLLKYDFPKI